MNNVASQVPQSGDKITTASHASMIYTVTVANSGNKYSWCVPDMYIYGGVYMWWGADMYIYGGVQIFIPFGWYL